MLPRGLRYLSNQVLAKLLLARQRDCNDDLVKESSEWHTTGLFFQRFWCDPSLAHLLYFIGCQQRGANPTLLVASPPRQQHATQRMLRHL